MNLSNMRALSEGAITPYEYDQLNEATKLDKYKLYQEDAQKISALLKEARAEDDNKKAKAKYQEALKNAKELKAKANKIPNNDVLDWIFDLFVKPWWWFLADVINATSKGDSITEMSRSQAVTHYDTLIKQIEKKIKDLD